MSCVVFILSHMEGVVKVWGEESYLCMHEFTRNLHDVNASHLLREFAGRRKLQGS